MQCILCKIYFWKVFHKYYNLICIFICIPICTKILFLSKVGVTHQALGGRQLRSWKKTPVDGEAEALENDLGWLEAAVFDDSMALYAMGSRGRVRGKEQRGIGFTKKKWVLLPP
jgi:hypothetical protein